MIRLLMFDFDGTLADSIEVIYNSIKKEVEIACCPLSKNFKRDMGDWPLREHLKRAGIRKNRERIVHNVKDDVFAAQQIIHPAKHLRGLKQIRTEKVILSNNSERFIRAWLRKHGIYFFREIHSPKEFHNKVEGIRKVLKQKKIKPEEALYVGDRDRDITAANAVGCVSIAIHNKIAWSTLDEIITAQPDFIISDLRQLKNIVSSLNSA